MIATFAPSRIILERLLALSGLVILLLEIFVFDVSPLNVLLIVLASLFLYVSLWRLTGGFVSERSNVVLRAEINRFLALVRDLYAGRSKGDSAAIHETKSRLRDSAERIIEAASKYQDEY